MKELKSQIEALQLDHQITLEDMPKIDLYMDQIIQLFEQKFSSAKRHEEEKVLTKTMINNYAKGKLLFPIKNKKYTQSHLMLISLIYQLKGGLSINDIKSTLEGLNKGVIEENLDLEQFYRSYLNVSRQNFTDFINNMEKKEKEAAAEMEGTNSLQSKELERILLIASMVNMSNLYRRAAESLIDELTEEKDSKEKEL